jgi:hypothetical protein
MFQDISAPQALDFFAARPGDEGNVGRYLTASQLGRLGLTNRRFRQITRSGLEKHRKAELESLERWVKDVDAVEKEVAASSDRAEASLQRLRLDIDSAEAQAEYLADRMAFELAVEKLIKIGTHPLMQAIRAGKLEKVRALVRIGIDTNGRYKVYTSTGARGYYYLREIDPLSFCLEQKKKADSEKIAALLVRNGAFVYRLEYWTGAAMLRYNTLINAMIRADIGTAQRRDVLETLFRFRNTYTIKCLLDNGADRKNIDRVVSELRRSREFEVDNKILYYPAKYYAKTK